MHLITVGLSHHTAPVAVREKVAFSASGLREALQDARRVRGVREATLLSTCNRTEVYAVCDSADEEPLTAFLCRNAVEHEVRGHLYSYRQAAAPRHLFRVASGTDSMVLGEGQILGQVREAARLANEESSAGPVLRRMFDHAVSCGRRVRGETEIGRGAVSVSHMAVDLARQIFGDLSGKNVLLLGAGEMAELTARLMVKFGVAVVAVANRTFERAEALAEAMGGYAVHYDEFPDRLVTADIVVSSTAAPHTIISEKTVRAAAARRRGRPMFFIDLAVPRDIESSVGDLNNVFLYNMDDLQSLVTDNLEGRRATLEAAHAVIEEEAAVYMHWLASLRTTPVVNELQRRFESIRREEWKRSERRLANLEPAERDAVEQMTRAMVKKMLHEPWRVARLAGDDAEAAAALQSLADVFGLESAEPPASEARAVDPAPVKQSLGRLEEA
jgi:glutamyl-tRNA reductase